MYKKSIASVVILVFATLVIPAANAALLTDPNDPRVWQGASIGTFAQLYYGANTAATRQLVIDNQLMDDGIFSPAGFTTASLLNTPWAASNSGLGCSSHDTTGTGSYAYTCYTTDLFTAANGIDNHWFQSSGVIGQTVFDLGFDASKAAVFNTIDHGPLPGEAIESTIYLSNDLSVWTQAVVERVWMEGFATNTGILWDGFVYAVGTGSTDTFRYASVIHGGPGALIDDGDDEINGIMGLEADFTGHSAPEPSTLALFGLALVGLRLVRRD